MKKVIFSILACTILLASCKKDDTNGNDNQTPNLGDLYIEGVIDGDTVRFVQNGKSASSFYNSNHGGSNIAIGTDSVQLLGFGAKDATSGATISFDLIRHTQVPRPSAGSCEQFIWADTAATYSKFTNTLSSFAFRDGVNDRWVQFEINNYNNNSYEALASSTTGSVYVTNSTQIGKYHIIEGTMTTLALHRPQGGSIMFSNGKFRLSLGSCN